MIPLVKSEDNQAHLSIELKQQSQLHRPQAWKKIFWNNTLSPESWTGKVAGPKPEDEVSPFCFPLNIRQGVPSPSFPWISASPYTGKKRHERLCVPDPSNLLLVWFQISAHGSSGKLHWGFHNNRNTEKMKYSHGLPRLQLFLFPCSPHVILRADKILLSYLQQAAVIPQQWQVFISWADIWS